MDETISRCGTVFQADWTWRYDRQWSAIEKQRREELSELERLREENARLKAELERLKAEAADAARYRANGLLLRRAAGDLLDAIQWFRGGSEGVLIATDHVHALAGAVDDTNFHPRPKRSRP